MKVVGRIAWAAWAFRIWLRSHVKWLYFRLLKGTYFQELGPGTWFWGRVRFGTVNGNIAVGKRCWIGHDVVLSAGRGCEIVIGDGVSLNTGCHVVAVSGIRIGANTAIGEYTSIRDQNHTFDRVDVPIKEQGFVGRSIEIGEDVWIGRGVMICPGVHIGNGAVVGANSVVTKDVEPYAVVAGCPARLIRRREQTA
jgi:acetyltransferase-like isoleucine patch superfamily enzyme